MEQLEAHPGHCISTRGFVPYNGTRQVSHKTKKDKGIELEIVSDEEMPRIRTGVDQILGKSAGV